MLQARTDRGRERRTNEDAVVAEEVSDGSFLLLVADGVGGYPGGEVASNAAAAAVHEHVVAHAGDLPEEALRAGFEAANRRIREEREASDRLAKMSTTLTAAIVRDGRAWVANAGDSRAYLFDGGELQQLTLDHSLVEEAIRAGELSPDDPEAALQRHVITRSLGPREDLEVDVFGPIELPPGSLLLLCTDGLHGVLEDREIAKVLAGSKRRYARDLVDEVLEYGAPDNVTVAVLAQPSAEGRR